MSDDADDISDAFEKNDGNPGTLSFIKEWRENPFL